MQLEISDNGVTFMLDDLKISAAIVQLKKGGPFTISVVGQLGSFKDQKAAKKMLQKALDAGGNIAVQYASMLLKMTTPPFVVEPIPSKVASPPSKAYNKSKTSRRSARSKKS